MIGYTDSQPIRTVQFPSNFQLSAARAQAVRTIIARSHRRCRRASVRKGAPMPIRSRPTRPPEGREQNRRIEIVLRRQD